jgi:hypothetical protein
MVGILMGVSVFSIGFLMLLVAVLDLLGVSPRNFGLGERFLVYGGGILLCIVGYYMASRRGRGAILPDIPMQSSAGFQQPPSYPPGFQPQTGMQPPGYSPGAVPPQAPGLPSEYQGGAPPEEF